MRHVELIPCKRFEWERIIRRARLAHALVVHLLEPPKKDAQERKVSGPTVKAVALALSSYANADGSNARPGVKRLAMVLETSERSVSAALDVLEQVGLVDKVYDGRGSRSIKASVYQLTRPDDLLDAILMLPESEVETRGPRYITRDDTSGSEPDDTSRSGDEEPTTRHGEADDSSQETDDSSLQNRRHVRTPAPDQPQDQTMTTSDHLPNVTHLAHAREAVRAARTSR